MIVAVLRENSVLVALLLSAYFLKKLTLVRVPATSITVAGMTMPKPGGQPRLRLVYTTVSAR